MQAAEPFPEWPINFLVSKNISWINDELTE